MKLNSPKNLHEKIFDYLKNIKNEFYIEPGANDEVELQRTITIK
ncbi:MAG: hypothetical protein ACOC33_01300 [bacterium]